MRAQLIIDCGGRVLTALLVTPDGQIVPVSQEIRNVATRHVSLDVLFDPRVTEHPDFVWEDALESLAKARARDFFLRARRVGLRRPWDVHASADALRLAPPLAVLSAPAALADRTAAGALPRFSLALMDALLEPAFAFAVDRRLGPAETDAVLVVPPHTGRAARNGLLKLVRRRGFRRVSIVRREIAAALTLLDGPATECVVADATTADLHVHRISFGGVSERTVRAVQSSTLRGFGWTHWASRIAAAVGASASATFDRSLVALLTGSPESLPSPVTQTALHAALDDAWSDAERREWGGKLLEAFEAIGAGDVPMLFIGEIFALDGVRRVLDSAPSRHDGIDVAAKGVAHAVRWLAADPSRTLLLESGGSLRLDTLHGEAIELLSADQTPGPGESCHVERTFRFAGEQTADSAFLVHLLWGRDAAPEGNATLAAVPLDLRHEAGAELQLTVHIRRSSSGARLSGTARAQAGRNAVTAQFSHDLEVRR